MYTKLIILVLLTSLASQCGFDQKFRGYQITQPKQKHRLLVEESQTWRPLRFHYVFIQELDIQNQQFLINILEIIKNFYGKHLLVRRSKEELNFSEAIRKNDDSSQQHCVNTYIEQKHLNVSYKADLVFFIMMSSNKNDDFLAWAAPCGYEKNTMRPLFGLINFNSAFIDLDLLNNIIFEKQVQIMLHETVHGLGLIKFSFSDFFDSTTNTKYIDSDPNFWDSLTFYQLLPTPRLTKLARLYYNCSTALGMKMENQGGFGPALHHFERRVIYNELMTASDMVGDFQISLFTFQLLQDSGFYRLSDIKPDPVIWGKNQGCNFFNEGCKNSTYPEFCTKYDNVQTCSFEQTGLGVCRNDYFSDTCSYIKIDEDNDCRDPSNMKPNQYFGQDSACFEGTLGTGGGLCLQYKCNSDGDIEVIINNKTFTCTHPSEELKIGNQVLTCPKKFTILCNEQSECENQCNQRGICMGGKCHCKKGFSGSWCNEVCHTYRNNDQCVEECPSETFPDEYTQNCIGCPFGCKKCSAIDKCDECFSNFQNQNQFCELVSLRFNKELILNLFEILLLGIILNV